MPPGAFGRLNLQLKSKPRPPKIKRRPGPKSKKSSKKGRKVDKRKKISRELRLVKHDKFDKHSPLKGVYRPDLAPYSDAWGPWKTIDPRPNKFLQSKNRTGSTRLSLRTKIRIYLLSLKYFKVTKAFRKRKFPLQGLFKRGNIQLTLRKCEKQHSGGLYKQLPAWPQPLGNGFFNFRALKPKDWTFSLPMFYQFIKSLREYRSIFGMDWWSFRNKVAENLHLTDIHYVNGLQSDEGAPHTSDDDAEFLY